MSELPKGWVAAHISDMLSIRNGYAFKSTDFCDEGVLLIRQSELRGGTVDVANAVYLPENFLLDHQTYSISKGDVLIGMSGSLGKVSRYLDDRPALQNQRTGLLAVNDDVADRTFSLYALKYVEPQILEQGKGVAVQNVSSSQIESCHVPLPPRAEQTRIVEKLEELLTSLDAGVAELKAAQKKLAQYRQSLLKAAVEGALTAKWRAANKPTETGAQLLKRILQERRARWESKQLAKFKEQGKAPPKDWQKKYSEPVQPDTTGLSELPNGWVWASVEQLGHVQLGRQRSPSKVGKANPTPYIRAANITEAGVDLADVLEMEFSETEKETFALKAGDVLLTEASGSPEHVGRPAIWRQTEGLFCFQNTVLRFSPEGVGSEYSFFSFLAMQKLGVFGKLSGGVGINHLSAGKFSKLPVPLPPSAEQSALVETIKESFARCDEQLVFNAHVLKQSTAQRQNILKSAFSGHLVPQDPSDEPASELLARIRAERAAQQAVKKPRGRKVKEAA